jgi:putative ABC transport system permease protein
MKTKSDILIKVLSLGVGLAVGIVLIAKVFFELSYDSFYKDIDRVYTINTWYSQNGDEHDYGQVSGAVSVGFMEEVPGVEVGTRTTYVFNGDTYLDEDGNKLKATLVCADTCFFKVFDRPILAGDPAKVLGKWGSVMVSRSFAEKMGGRDDIWYCTNIEFMDCMDDYARLQFAADNSFVRNPNARDCWIQVNDGTPVGVPAGEILKL